MTATKITIDDWTALVAECNAHMLGLGAPVARDDMGYNKADHGPCLNAGSIPEGDLLVDVAGRLLKYRRQLGTDRTERVKAGLGLYSDQLSSVRGRPGVSAIRKGAWANLFFKYNTVLLDILRGTVPPADRRWDRDGGCWRVALARLEVLADAMEGQANTAGVRKLLAGLTSRDLEPVKIGGVLRIEIVEQDDELVISHPYDKVLLGAYRTIRLCWDRTSKTYRITRQQDDKARQVLDAYVRLGDGVRVEGLEILKGWAEPEEEAAPVNLIPVKEVLRDGMTPFPFQEEGVDFIERTGYSCIIGDEMGLGKTVQAIIAAGRTGQKSLVVCPAGLKYNWAREVAKFTRLSAYVATTSTRIRQVPGIEDAVIGGPEGPWRDADFVVINGDLLIDAEGRNTSRKSKWFGPLSKASFGVAVVDESHHFKNRKAKRTKALAGILKAAGITRRILLTGTVIENRPSELYAQLRLVAPGIAGKWWMFAERYCDAYRDTWGFHADGASNIGELREKISPVYLRRTKKAVMPELPDKLRQIADVELSAAARHRYDEAAADFVSYLREIGDDEGAVRAARAEHLARLTALKQIVLKDKIKAAVEFVRNANGQGQKVVVFSWFTEVVAAVKAEFGDACATITGADNAAARDEAVRRVQEDDKTTVCAANGLAGGVGLTLTAASLVFFTDLPWAPTKMQQAEDRCHRIGQTDCVNVYVAIATGTVDETIFSLLLEKLKVVDHLQDGVESDEEGGGDIVSELIERMRGEAVDA